MIEEKNTIESGKSNMSKKQKMAISALTVIFLAVLVGAFWDLYGRNLLCNCSCSQQSSTEGSNSKAVSPTSGSQAVSGNQATLKSGQKGNKQGNKKNSPSNTAASSANYNSCINNTKDNSECKNCCDCLSGADSETRTACRNVCATHDFSTNSNFITVNAPSALGVSGDYSACTNQAGSGECKNCCESSMGLQCGDFKYCRTACNTKFGSTSGPQQ